MISIDQVFNNQYYKKSTWIYLLIPFSIFFYCLSSLKKYLYKNGFLKTIKIKVPVLIIGNITLGGTGKTSLALDLVEKFLRKGLKPAIISRGYRGSANNITEVFESSDVSAVGDEALLIKTKSKIPVFIGKDRANVAKILLKKHPETSIIISDDGLQHHRLARDYEIIVVDSQRQFGNGLIFPAGPLRECISKLKQVDAVVYKSTNSNSSFYQMKYITKHFKNLLTNKTTIFKGIQDKKIVAITAIGNPESFFSTLEGYDLEFKKVTYNDHYLFNKNDFIKYEDYNIVMTEKDAIKCQKFAMNNFWVLPLETKVDERLFRNILKKVT